MNNTSGSDGPFEVPELTGKQLGAISSDFIQVADKLKEASYVIRTQGKFDYPIFPMSRTPVEMGALLIEPGENTPHQWYYYAAYLEAFVQNKLIDQDKIEDFKKTYKNPDEFCCLFVVDAAFMSFIHIPYPESR